MIKQLRVLVLKAASGIEGMTGLVEEGKRQFTMMCADINSVHPELRDVVMNVAVANGGLEGMCRRLAVYRLKRVQFMHCEFVTVANVDH